VGNRYAMKQIYAADDQYYYTRPARQTLGRGSTLFEDPNLKVREDSAELSNLVDELSRLSVIEASDLAKMLQAKWRISSTISGSEGARLPAQDDNTF
jgi:hypothetical protein